MPKPDHLSKNRESDRVLFSFTAIVCRQQWRNSTSLFWVSAKQRRYRLSKMGNAKCIPKQSSKWFRTASSSLVRIELSISEPNAKQQNNGWKITRSDPNRLLVRSLFFDAFYMESELNLMNRSTGIYTWADASGVHIFRTLIPEHGMHRLQARTTQRTLCSWKWITRRIKCFEFNSIFVGLMTPLRSWCGLRHHIDASLAIA